MKNLNNTSAMMRIVSVCFAMLVVAEFMCVHTCFAVKVNWSRTTTSTDSNSIDELEESNKHEEFISNKYFNSEDEAHQHNRNEFKRKGVVYRASKKAGDEQCNEYNWRTCVFGVLGFAKEQDAKDYNAEKYQGKRYVLSTTNYVDLIPSSSGLQNPTILLPDARQEYLPFLRGEKIMPIWYVIRNPLLRYNNRAMTKLNNIKDSTKKNTKWFVKGLIPQRDSVQGFLFWAILLSIAIPIFVFIFPGPVIAVIADIHAPGSFDWHWAPHCRN